MKLLTLHRRNAYIQYKHTFCSWAAVFVILGAILTVILPFYFAFYLFNDIWSQYKITYEHPDVKFQYKYIFVAEYMGENALDTTVTTCTSYNYLNELFEDFSECSMIKVSPLFIFHFLCGFLFFFIRLILKKLNLFLKLLVLGNGFRF